LRLAFRPPFAWDALLGFLAHRAIPGVEAVEDGTYRRTFDLDGARGTVAVHCVPERHHLVARIRSPSAAALPAIVVRLRRLFDLQADPEAIAAHLSSDPRLAPAVRALPGLRVPGAWDGFELAVRAVLGQQVSVVAARTLAGRLVTAYGEPLAGVAPGDALRATFPRAAMLARADVARIGMPRTRGQAIRHLAAAVAGHRVDLDAPGDPETTLAALRALPGIGEWTAQYVAMRALREPDAFPAGDLGLRHAWRGDAVASLPAQRARNGNGGSNSAGPRGRKARSTAPHTTTRDKLRPCAPARLEEAARAWRPWRAYAALYLWTWEGPDAAAD
jgi:AraC family transcriptional regulator of adaptative response / DNA-3-methyladenine glycosylase II